MNAQDLVGWIELRNDEGRYLGRFNYVQATVEIRHRGEDVKFALDLERIPAVKANVVEVVDNNEII
jgi:hypothetical protein